jgi:hypothetical protein
VGVRIQDESSNSIRRYARAAAHDNGLHVAAVQLDRANQPRIATSQKLAALIEAIQLTDGVSPGNPLSEVNRAATTQIVSIMQAANFAPLDVAGYKHPLTIRRESKNTLNPQTSDRLIRADTISIRGLRRRTQQSGSGVPYVAWFAPKSPSLRGQAGIPPLAGLSEPVTAVVETHAGQPALVFYRTLQTDHVNIGGKNLSLAADYSGQLAYLITQGRNRNLDINALLFTDRNMDNAGLYQFERFDPDKIPVVFVHGLMSRPETWTQAVNQLLSDQEIRARYQFWFFLDYPSGRLPQNCAANSTASAPLLIRSSATVTLTVWCWPGTAWVALSPASRSARVDAIFGSNSWIRPRRAYASQRKQSARLSRSSISSRGGMWREWFFLPHRTKAAAWP